MLPRYEQFIKEKAYCQNVSPATVSWYTCAHRWLPNENPSDSELKQMVIRMREAGLKPTGANAAIRAVNAYLKWAGSPHHIKQMKEERFVPPTFTSEQITRFTRWRPTGFYDRRLHLFVLILLDTGCRASEVTHLRVSDCDLDNMLLLIHGKGRKDRRVPFSLELRRTIYRFIQDFGKQPHMFLLSTKDGRALSRHVALRDVKRLCLRLRFQPPARTLHAFRSTFATEYLRRGGSVGYLQRILGHTTVAMVMRYVSLQTDDLSAACQRLSLLS